MKIAIGCDPNAENEKQALMKFIEDKGLGGNICDVLLRHGDGDCHRIRIGKSGNRCAGRDGIPCLVRQIGNGSRILRIDRTVIPDGSFKFLKCLLRVGQRIFCIGNVIVLCIHL